MKLDGASDIENAFGVSRETIEMLEHFVELTLKWSPRINLISKSTHSVIWSRHIADSLQIVPLISGSPTSWLDLGSGGGFPGVVAAICLKPSVPECRFTLVDSDSRKGVFLKTVARELDLNMEVLSDRIQDIVRPPSDIITARALARLPDLLEMAHPHVKKNSVCLFLKGADADCELTQARESWTMEVEQIKSITNPNGVILKIGGLARV